MTRSYASANGFAGDTEPGDLNGQGVGGTWFAVGPKGEKAGQ
ncbi:hypothetical protein ACIP98_02370 [Streptomyces sp. NPDC088354]